MTEPRVLHALDRFLPRSPENGAATAWHCEREAVDASLKFLRERYAKARCDCPAVSECVRCNTMYLVRVVEDVAAYVDARLLPPALAAALRPFLRIADAYEEKYPDYPDHSGLAACDWNTLTHGDYRRLQSVLAPSREQTLGR